MRERRAYDCREGCPVESTIQFISGKWKSVILYHLLKDSVVHFGELNAEIPGCSPRMLAKQLSELEQDDIVNKTIYSTDPLITDYTLTEFGKSLEPVIMTMAIWGEQYNDDAKEASN